MEIREAHCNKGVLDKASQRLNTAYFVSKSQHFGCKFDIDWSKTEMTYKS
jgi:hypothetical protein